MPRVPDTGDGGIRRVVEAQERWLSEFGWEVVDDPEQADVIACHVTFPGVEEFLTSGKPGGWIRRYPGKALVLHCHGLYWSGPGDPYKWGIQEDRVNAEAMESMRIADWTTSPSEWVTNCLRRHLSRPVETVWHGIELDEWTPPEQHGGYVLWDKSRPDPICDPEPVLRLAQAMPDVKFVTTFLPSGVVPPNVLVTGRIPYAAARDLTLNAGVYLGTVRGTFEISILQALAAGVPVAAWRWGGQTDYLPAEWMTDPGDLDATAAMIRKMLADRAAYSSRARAIAERFSWRDMVAHYAAGYSRALAARTEARSTPRTTVVVPAYKMEEYLPATLDSVAAQIDQDWECIVIDDGSPDRCGEIAETYAAKDPRFSVIHQTNQYLAAARNTGIAAARGTYILPLDADDMLDPQAIALLAEAMDANRHIGVAYGGVHFVEIDGKTPKDYSKYAGRPLPPGQSGWPFKYDHRIQMQERGQIPPYCSMFRKEAWAFTGGYRERWQSSEDCDFWCRVTEYGWRPQMVTEATTLIYRDRPGSMSKTKGWSDREVKAWFPSSRDAQRSPAGAATMKPLPVASLDPPGTSVLIPVGPGHGKLLLDAIDSVAAQTSNRWECVVVNDTGENLPNLPTWVRVVDRVHRYGSPASSRSAGLLACKGKFVLPLDADDLLEPTAIEVLMHAATLAPNHVLYPDWFGNPQRGESWDPKAFELKQGMDWSVGAIRAKAPFGTVALFPRKALEAIGGWKDVPWEDWDLQIRLVLNGMCFRRVAWPCFVYRMHQGSVRETAVANIAENVRRMRESYPELWQQEALTMGCGCGGKTIIPPSSAPASASPDGMVGDKDMVLVAYVGGQASKFHINGESTKTPYVLQPNRPTYVWRKDAEFMISRSDFQLVTRAADPVAANPTDPSRPTLVAAR